MDDYLDRKALYLAGRLDAMEEILLMGLPQSYRLEVIGRKKELESILKELVELIEYKRKNQNERKLFNRS